MSKEDVTRNAHVPRLDRLDEEILFELVRDARISNNALAEKLHVAPSTTHARLRSLKESGVFLSAHARINYPALGLPLQAVVTVRLRDEARRDTRRFGEYLVRLPPVLNVLCLGGPDDFIVQLVATSSEHVRDFVAMHLGPDQGVASAMTSLVFDWLRGEEYADAIEGFADSRRLPQGRRSAPQQ